MTEETKLDQAPRDINTAPRDINTAPRDIGTAPRETKQAPRVKILVMGDLLWDSYPEKKVLGGCMANVAYRLVNCPDYFKRFASLSLPTEPETKLLSAVGDDTLGKEAVRELTSLGVDTELTISSNYPTGVVNITFDALGEPHYAFAEGERSAFNHIGDAYTIGELQDRDIRNLDKTFDDLDDPKTALLRYARDDRNAGIMVLNGGALFYENNYNLARFLRPAVTECWLDPNLRPGSYCRESLEKGFELATHVKLNSAELLEIGQLMSLISKKSLDTNSKISEIVATLIERFQLKALFVTKGEHGIDCYLADDSFRVTQKISSNPKASIKAVDPVGAGDSVTAVLVYASAVKHELQETLDVAHTVGAHVVQTQGAMGII